MVMSDGVRLGVLDIGINGAPSVLLPWDKTRNYPNPDRGLTVTSTSPSMLVTRNPAVTDITEADRIAVPGIKISINAMSKVAAQHTLGKNGRSRLDLHTTGLGHPDAMKAMLSGKRKIPGHFSGPPFSTIEIEAGGRAILTAKDELGDGWDIIMFGTTAVHDKTPSWWVPCWPPCKMRWATFTGTRGRRRRPTSPWPGTAAYAGGDRRHHPRPRHDIRREATLRAAIGPLHVRDRPAKDRARAEVGCVRAGGRLARG